MYAHTLLLVLLSIFHPPAVTRARLDARHATIVADADAAADHYGVPVGILLFVGYAETHLGADSGEGGGWGSPIDARHRHTAGRADHAARDLAASFRACGTWIGAITRFRSGQCVRRHVAGYSPAFAVRTVERMYQTAGLSAPDHLR